MGLKSEILNNRSVMTWPADRVGQGEMKTLLAARLGRVLSDPEAAARTVLSRWVSV